MHIGFLCVSIALLSAFLNASVGDASSLGRGRSSKRCGLASARASCGQAGGRTVQRRGAAHAWAGQAPARAAADVPSVMTGNSVSTVTSCGGCEGATPDQSDIDPREHDSGGRFAAGFTLTELLIVVVVIAMLLSLLIPSLGAARRAGRKAVCSSNLRQLATSAASYAVDFKSYIYMFSWTSGNTPTAFPDLVPPGGVFASAAHSVQATDIIRRRSPSEPNFRFVGLWCPAIEYSHLVLLDYMSAPLPVPIAACPEDRPLQLWQGDIAGFNAGVFGVQQPAFTGFEANIMRAKPYSSSYETPPATYDRSTPPDRLSQSNATHYIYGIDSNTRFGPARFEQVAFPSLKVHLYDTHQRHSKRQLFFAHPEAVQPVLQFDSSVVDRKTSDSGLGWQPNRPDLGPTTIIYAPYQYEPRTSNGAPTESFAGRYRWTRGGLKGIDFGPEVTGVR